MRDNDQLLKGITLASTEWLFTPALSQFKQIIQTSSYSDKITQEECVINMSVMSFTSEP